MKPRLIKPQKISIYCNTYQMTEQQGSYQGLDTWNVVSFGDFANPSIILGQSEARTIKYRADINVHINNLVTDNVIPPVTASGYRENARKNNPSQEIIDKCLIGAIYIELEDAMVLQHEIGSDNIINVLCDHYEYVGPKVIETKRSWLSSIIYAQKLDSYGARFPVLPQFTCKKMDTRVVWMLSVMITLVKELWSRTDKCDMVVSKWHGWMLAFLTGKCFPFSAIRNERMNPYKPSDIRTNEEILEKFNMEDANGFDHNMKLADIFEDHENVSVVFNSNILAHEGTQTIANLVSDEEDIIIIIYDEIDLSGYLDEELRFGGNIYKTVQVKTSDLAILAEARYSCQKTLGRNKRLSYFLPQTAKVRYGSLNVFSALLVVH